MRRLLSFQEIAIIRRDYRKIPAPEIARAIGRSASAVYQTAKRLGLSIPQRITAPAFVAYLREKHALGWSDTEIAASYGGVDRHCIPVIRQRLGLPSVLFSQHQRDKVRRKTTEQLRAAGVESLGALRAKILKERSAKAGWPADLPWRAGQILTLLWEHGPMTRVQIVEAIRPDLIGKCTRKRMNQALNDNDAWHGKRHANSYLATLIRRGLVVSLGRVVRKHEPKRGNFNVVMYSLPLGIQRREGGVAS